MLKKLVRWCFLHLGPWRLIRFMQRRNAGAGITILYGHRVMPDAVIADSNDPRSVTGHTSVSEVQHAIDFLKKYYTFISMDEAVSQIKTGKIVKESIVLTFDDGFRDNYLHLLPILQKNNIPATFYVNPSVIGTNKNLWFQAIINYFFAVQESEVYVELNQQKYDLSSAKKRYAAAFDFMQYLQANRKPEEFLATIEQEFSTLSLPDDSDIHVTWQDMQALAKEPLITLGAHSHNHYPLGYCNEELSKYEIITSIEEIEQNLNIKVEHFSYPRGHREDFNQHHIEVLKNKKILSATTTLRGVNRRHEDLYSLKRVGFPQNISNDKDDFLWYVAGIPQLIEKIRAFVKGN